MENSSRTAWRRDPYVRQAKDRIRELFAEQPERVFYLKQLEVLLEKSFFHWVTSRAVSELLGEGFMKSEEVPLIGSTRLKFLVSKSNRYYRRTMMRMAKIVREYSQPRTTTAYGEQADLLFSVAFAHRGFLLEGEDVNARGVKQWTKTAHNLDFVMSRDGTAYGVEVKNKWDYIEKEELETKVELCEFLGLTPLFIVRYAPKTDIEYVRQYGGFTLLFEAQIYPFGYEALVERIREGLGLPVDSPRRIPAGIVERFVGWHSQRITTL